MITVLISIVVGSILFFCSLDNGLPTGYKAILSCVILFFTNVGIFNFLIKIRHRN